MKRYKGFKIGNQLIKPGERKVVHLDVAKLYDFTDISISAEVICGREPGPRLFLSGAIHGDEINGIEIIRRVLSKRSVHNLKGTLVAVPIVNVFGFNNRSRYLPDRRDLNRCFPGSSRGPLASQIASLFMKEVVNKCTHGIDFHTGAIHRSNYPQVRTCIDDRQAKKLAMDFGAPVVLDSKLRDGSLREATRRRKIPFLLYEGGEALRFNETAIRTGVNGCLRVMRAIGMIPRGEFERKHPFIAKDSQWIRANHSGSFTTQVDLGDRVRKGEEIAVIYDPFGKTRISIISDCSGVVIGRLELPLVNKGDALFHIATSKSLRKPTPWPGTDPMLEHFN